MDNKVLAKVNGAEITENDLKITISKFPSERQGQFLSEEGKKQLLNQMVSFELMYSEALETGIDKDEQYLAQLELAKKELMTQTAINKLLQQVSVTEDEVADYYKANKQMFEAPVTVSAKHILVETEEKAMSIKEEIEAGKSFEKAAEDYSSCPSKAEGGNLGSFTRGQMVPEFENVAFNLEVGVVSAPVKTQFGYHLIKVEDKKEGTERAFDEVKGMIWNNLLQERQNYKFMSATEELKKKFSVEIL
jgi:peptidyl-prolyl cis-trans isomerase C